MGLMEKEVRLMDSLPRHEAYVSMLTMGLAGGFLIAVLLNLLLPLILAFIPIGLSVAPFCAAVMLLLFITPWRA